MGSVQLQMNWLPGLLSQKRTHGPPLGLKNLGNSCYLNSVIQCLTYTTPLANFCLRLQHSSFCDSDRIREIKKECPFCILEKRIVRSLSTNLMLDAPVKIQSCLGIYAEHFQCGRQEDAHEFLRYVIDACHNTCLGIKKVRALAGGYSIVKEIFGGSLMSQVKCLSCNNDSNKVDEIMDISIDISHSTSLKEGIKKFFQPEILDGSNKYKCEICKKLVTARKQMLILQAPNVLVIHLKRFEGMFGQKIDKAITFEEFLLLSGFMWKISQDPLPEYNLFGTIVHSGCSPESGHYYAYIKDAVGQWYCCNDSYVTHSTVEGVLSDKAYILFFSRTKQRSISSSNAFSCNGTQPQPHDSNSLKPRENPMVAQQSDEQQPVLGNGDTHVDADHNLQKEGFVNDLVLEDEPEKAGNAFFVGDDGSQSAQLGYSSLEHHSDVADQKEHGGCELHKSAVNRHRGIYGTKRKKPIGPYSLLSQDLQSLAKVKELKEVLRQEASSVLKSCGWADEAYSFMCSRKKSKPEPRGNELSEEDFKKLLIADAKQWLIPKIPSSLKEELVNMLRSFI